MKEHVKNLVCLKVNHVINILDEIDIHPGTDSRKLDTAIILLNEVKKYCEI